MRTIKQRLRTMMNGVASHSMREKGVCYKVNFGVELPRLQAFAEEVKQEEGLTSEPRLMSLALSLWNEPIRECRLLACMLMPAGEMDEQMAEMWVEQMQWQEEAQCTVMHLFQHLPVASVLAFRWIAREEPMFRLTGWLLMARLFMQGLEPSQRDADELLDQAAAELRHSQSAPAEGQLPIGRAVHSALLKYMDLSVTASVRGEEVLRQVGL